MKKKKPAMNSPKQHNLRPCYIDVTKLSLTAISRLTINPLYISNRCGRCDQITYHSPKCTTCSVPYHYECALLRKRCCGFSILLHSEKSPQSICHKCKKAVAFGPYCSICHSKFHSYCITPFDQCCQLNLYNFPQQQCAKCEQIVIFGPKCPICRKMYHVNCSGPEFQCCDLKFPLQEEDYYRCGKCKGAVGLGCPICQFCGEFYHSYCIRSNKTCCGKPIPFEVLFIPSFTRAANHFKLFLKRRSELRRKEEMVVQHSHTLRSMTKKIETPFKRIRKKSASSQTYALDSVTIVSVKTEPDEKEMDFTDTPPILERETSCTPEPSSSTSRLQKPDSNSDSDDTLRNLFEFLYSMVKKFPPQLQTQVKIDLFKTVTEAEMKLHCNMLESGLASNEK